MTSFVIRRIAGLVLSLLATSFLVFASMYFAPGSPESVIFGATTPSPETREAVRAQYHLDDPFLIRYGRWVGDILQGDLGKSLVGGQSVADRISGTIGTTVSLVALAATMIVIIGVGLGLSTGLFPGRIDSVLSMLVAIASSIPAYVTASLLISVFAIGLGWFPAYGRTGDELGGQLGSLVLPALSLALVASALLARITRASVRTEACRDYVVTARARSITQREIVRKHILPNAAAPILTACGLLVASLFAGTIVVESAFGLNGMGSLLVGAVNSKDFPTVQAVTLIMVTAFVLTNTIIDIVIALMDPRTKGVRL